ncbi:DUF5131 family protein, partial [Microcoleus sp. Pol12B5]|uniref:DUF5131 family protein n=1 Tax=Microcoleus sp. Pol12B5 TaxID=3055396 RepID=UPI002FD2FFD8
MSLIHWTDITANPIHIVREDGSNGGHFCNKVSLGCLHCFPEAQNQSSYFSFASHLPYAGKAPKNLIFDDVVMEKLLRMRSGKKVFLCSMTDLFGEWVPDEWIDKAFVFMLLAQQHTFQILTKRPQRMQHYLSDPATIHRVTKKASDLMNLNCLSCWPLPNVWVGTSIENQEVVDQRIPHLLNTPAVVRFLSCEPLLEKIDLLEFLNHAIRQASRRSYLSGDFKQGTGDRFRRQYLEDCQEGLGQMDSTPLVEQLQSGTSRDEYCRLFTHQSDVQQGGIS